MLGDHLVPLRLIGLLEGEPFRVGAVTEERGIASIFDRTVHVRPEHQSVVHRDRNVDVDLHAVADHALGFQSVLAHSPPSYFAVPAAECASYDSARDRLPRWAKSLAVSPGLVLFCCPSRHERQGGAERRLSIRGPAAVQDEGRAGHEGRGVARQENDRAHDVLNLSEPAEFDVLEHGSQGKPRRRKTDASSASR